MKRTSFRIIEKIIYLREQNKPVREIGEILNISKSTVAKYVKELELDLLSKPKLDQKIVDIILSSTDSISSKKLATDLKISISTIYKYRKLAGYKRKLLSEEERRKRNKESYNKNKRNLKQKYIEYKGGKCEKCGYNKSLNALEFHHRNPKEKEFTLSGIRRGWEETKRELDKCDLFCSNCHREIHDKTL